MTTTIVLALLLFATSLAARGASRPVPPPNVDRAIRHASKMYGTPYREMVAVAWCESRFNSNAVGQGSHGLYQFLRGTWARTPFRWKNIYSPWWNAHAAAWLWRHDGRSWHEWTCGRLNGFS